MGCPRRKIFKKEFLAEEAQAKLFGCGPVTSGQMKCESQSLM
jgi:hypothetical protein